MTVYKITAIERIDGSPSRPHDAEKLGKSVRIVSLKIGEPAVLAYVDDPICTLWTPEVYRLLELADMLYALECEGITYIFDEKVGD